MIISKSKLKLIKSLSQKKYRKKYNLFVTEGIKIVQEFLDSSFEIHSLFCTDDYFCDISEDKITRISEAELKKISNLKSPNKVLAIFKIRKEKPVSNDGISIVLNSLKTPGNLGTIIRLCDWFGVKELVCSNDTVDCYNPKVVQASMGSLSRVSVHFLNLLPYLSKTNLPIFIADSNGENVYKKNLPEKGILIMGNEANGVSKEIKELVSNKISIPKFGENNKTESLNVAISTSIILSEFKRRTLKKN